MNNLVIIESNVQNHDIHIYKLDPQLGIENYDYDTMLDFIVNNLGFEDDVHWFIDYEPTTIHVYPEPDEASESVTYIEI